MKILSLGLDNSILDKTSRLARRVIEYGEMTEKYVVIVPARHYREVDLSAQAKAYGAGKGGKISQLFQIYKLGKKLLQEEKFAIITVQDQYFLGWAGLKLAKKFNLGLEVQVHGLEKYRGLRKLVAKYVIPRADAIRVVSQRLKRWLVRELGVDAEKITVIPIFTKVLKTTGLPRPLRSAPGARNDIVFLTVGRLVPVKNIEMQIRAMNNEKLKMNKAELWIIGGDGPESKKLEVRSKKLKLGGIVKFLGWQDDLDEYYKKADAFLLTSDYEGWGLAVIEAAAYGLPIIMTDVGCAGEVIKNNESGLVIPVGDQQALEEAMIKLIENPELRQKLGQGARQAVAKLPGKEETLKLYKKSWNKARR